MLVDEDNQAGLMFGRICAVDALTCRIRVRLDDRDGMQTHWIYVPQRNTHENKHRSLPDMESHVAVLLAANGVDGVFLGAIYSDTEPPPITDTATEFVRFSDGTIVSHDREASRFAVNCSGSVDVVAANQVKVTAGIQVVLDSDVVITGNATVRKKLIIDGGIEMRGGDDNTATIAGNVLIDGNVKVTGTVMDEGGNSNHHSH